MINKLMTKTILIDGRELVSDIKSSKNVIKISDMDTAVIYITPSINTLIRPKDIDALIMDLSWGCDYNESECHDYDWGLKMVVGKAKGKDPRYVSATLSAKNTEDAKNKIEKYKLDSTLPIIKRFLMSKNIKIYLHRYIMGMYSVDRVQVIREKFGISDEQFNVKGLSYLQVHHMDGNPLDNFSDRLMIVKPEKHSHMKRKDTYAYNLYSGQFTIWRMDNKVWLEIRNLESNTVTGFIIDLDNDGINIAFLKNYMAAEVRNSRDYMLMADNKTEAFRRLPLCRKNAQLKYEHILKVMEFERKIKIIVLE